MPTMTLRERVLNQHPHAFFLLSSFILSVLALKGPNLPALALLIGVLLVYVPFLVHRGTFTQGLALWLSITFGECIAYISSTVAALSRPAIAIAGLLFISALTTAIALLLVYLDCRIRSIQSLRTVRIVAFPIFWAAVWTGGSYVSPLGHLALWQPVDGVGPYRWVLPLCGPTFFDWATASWAIVASFSLERWLMGNEQEEERDAKSSDTTAIWGVVGLLLALALPSLFVVDLPYPVVSPQTTPLSVACVLPVTYLMNHSTPLLEDYIKESKKFRSSTDIILWPEGAVAFRDATERDAAFDLIRRDLPGPIVAISYEEQFGARRDVKGQTAVALISHRDPAPHFVYYKRNLVPIAESYRFRHSDLPPTIYNLGIPAPKYANETRKTVHSVPITASICLDFATPYPFNELNSKPALVLAPAKTWHPNIGLVMWEQAKQRAAELDTVVLWCDGGKGGVSGIAGKGYSDIRQMGEQGSWSHRIGIKYPFDDDRTFWTRRGAIAIWVIPFVCIVKFPAAKRFYGLAKSLAVMITAKFNSFVGRRKQKLVRNIDPEHGDLMD